MAETCCLHESEKSALPQWPLFKGIWLLLFVSAAFVVLLVLTLLPFCLAELNMWLT